jgi:5'-3' exoribonuclease 1
LQAVREGQTVNEDRFDSNCITPGTGFMARLSAQLKYFIAQKVTTDARWRNVQVMIM